MCFCHHCVFYHSLSLSSRVTNMYLGNYKYEDDRRREPRKFFCSATAAAAATAAEASVVRSHRPYLTWIWARGRRRAGRATGGTWWSGTWGRRRGAYYGSSRRPPRQGSWSSGKPAEKKIRQRQITEATMAKNCKILRFQKYFISAFIKVKKWLRI